MLEKFSSTPRGYWVYNTGKEVPMPKSIPDLVVSLLGAIFGTSSPPSVTRTSTSPGVNMSRTHKNRHKEQKSKNKFKDKRSKNVPVPELYIPKGIRRLSILQGGMEDMFIDQYRETFGDNFELKVRFFHEATSDPKLRLNRNNVSKLEESIYLPLSLSEHFDNNYNSLIYVHDTHKEYLMSSIKIWGGHTNSFIHHTATIPDKVKGKPGFLFDDGVWVMPHCVIGKEVWLSTGATLCHAARVYADAVIEPYVWVSPGARIYKHCIIGEASFVGAGAIVTAGVSVGSRSYISSGAYLTKDVPDNSVVLEGVNNIRTELKAEDCFARFQRCKRRLLSPV